MKTHRSRIDLVMGVCMASCLTAMALLVFLNVVLRYGFNSGITWSEEMSRYLFLFMLFFGIAQAFRDGEHLAVDMVTRRCPPPIRKALGALSFGLMAFTLILLVKGSWTLIEININTKGPVTGMPLWLIYAGSLLMGLAMMMTLVFGLLRSRHTDATD